jgi:methylated-DNA-[protein]-cysteine S-methyltransferase
MSYLLMTLFQKKVFDALKQIPKGKVSTYKLLGDFISCNSAQAIGQALKKNTNAPAVPCHRIIKSDLSMGGYFGETSGETVLQKVELLKSEGIKLDSKGKLIDTEQLYTF